MRSDLLAAVDTDEVADVQQHTGELWRVLVDGSTADLPEPERAQGAAMAPGLADPTTNLRHGDLRHQLSPASTAAGTGRLSSFRRAGSGSTSEIVLPRMRATSSGRRSFFSASTVALAMLIGFVVPRLFARMSRMPASSSTARTPPPAMTPVPSLAGRSRTRAASNRPRLS